MVKVVVIMDLVTHVQEMTVVVVVIMIDKDHVIVIMMMIIDRVVAWIDRDMLVDTVIHRKT
jgi:hypothetical protein